MKNLCLQNGGNSQQEKPLVASLIFILNYHKNWIMFMMISNIEFKRFQINLMLEFFLCLSLECL
jgi:hypothetical protein